MKTLFERLKPEHKAKLDIEAEKYPHAVKATIKEMNDNNSILDLKYNTILSLSMYLHLKNYDITEILNLFES